MSNFVHGAGFRISGVVTRKWCNSAGTFASLTVEVTAGGRKSKLDLKGFDAEVVNEIAQLGEGMTVEVTGGIGNEKLTNKDKTAVKRDGYDAWVPLLTVKKIKAEAAPEKAPEAPMDPDDVAF